MTPAKRIIFTLTAGRSGTMYLAHVLNGLPGLTALHEPVPGFHELLPAARYDAALARRFLQDKKLPFIASFSQPAYVETSHYFAKGFLDPLLELGIVPDLIFLRRNPREVASSWFLFLGGMSELRHGAGYTHMLGPQEPNFLPAQNFDAWNDYQLCYWYALESHFRGRHYAQLIASRGGRIFETFLEPLASGERYAQLLAWLDMPPAIITSRNADKTLRSTRINEQIAFKMKAGREPQLASIDRAVLEAQVLTDCNISPQAWQS